MTFPPPTSALFLQSMILAHNLVFLMSGPALQNPSGHSVQGPPGAPTACNHMLWRFVHMATGMTTSPKSPPPAGD
eukprot:93347-Heterocapsa_arctica.AAC.1